VYDKGQGRKVRRLFDDPAGAAKWRADAKRGLSDGKRATSGRTIREAWYEWEADAERGTVRNRSGDEYKPSALRSYAATFRLRIDPALGESKLAALTRRQIQDWVDGMIGDGCAPSTVSTTLAPLRNLYARAMERDEVTVNPTIGVRLPAVRGRRERIATPEECEKLLEALPEEDRVIWATMMYAGLRRGEVQALRIGDVNGTIDVERSWDPVKGPVAPKSRQGKRRVPVAENLRKYLDAHKTKWSEGLIFGNTPDEAFTPQTLVERAKAAWKEAGLDPITPHECRHTFASLMIAAGVNAKALSVYMGHSTVSFTMDRYGHLMPGNEDEAAGLLDAYLDAA
jgi:integrase